MNNINAIASKKHNDKSIELTYAAPNGTEIKKRYAAIRGGIAWPTATNPAYAVIIGQEYSGTFEPNEIDPPQGKKVLLAEVQTSSLNLEAHFYLKLADLSGQLLCEDFYYAVPPGVDLYNDSPYFDFSTYCRRRNCSARLQEAPDADNLAIGVSRVVQELSRGNLDIPEDAIVYQELKSLTREDLAQSPDTLSYAFNALRHVIGSFCRLPPNIYKPHRLPPAKDWRLP